MTTSTDHKWDPMASRVQEQMKERLKRKREDSVDSIDSIASTRHIDKYFRKKRVTEGAKGRSKQLEALSHESHSVREKVEASSNSKMLEEEETAHRLHLSRLQEMLQLHYDMAAESQRRHHAAEFAHEEALIALRNKAIAPAKPPTHAPAPAPPCTDDNEPASTNSEKKVSLEILSDEEKDEQHEDDDKERDDNTPVEIPNLAATWCPNPDCLVTDTPRNWSNGVRLRVKHLKIKQLNRRHAIFVGEWNSKQSKGNAVFGRLDPSYRLYFQISDVDQTGLEVGDRWEHPPTCGMSAVALQPMVDGMSKVQIRKFVIRWQ
ncbi:hypothetical protein MMC12_008112 [Toensbergia leucococca]|nr:hypothetical protein [Toensbergia leucococca]